MMKRLVAAVALSLTTIATGVAGVADPALAEAPGPAEQPSVVRTVTGPDYKVVRYIRDLNVATCTASMFRAVPVTQTFQKAQAVAGCVGLDKTANPTPSASIASSVDSWHNFLKSREYRMVLHLPRYTLRCDDSGQAISTPTPDVAPFVSYGYTPLRLKYLNYVSPATAIAGLDGALYIPADPYLGGGGIWNTGTPVLEKAEDGRSYHITYRVAARLSWVENVASPLVTPIGNAAPNVWAEAQQDLRCDGTAPTAVFLSSIPSTHIYKDGQLVNDTRQTTELGRFISSGIEGNDFFPGTGVLDPYCTAVAFDGPDAAPACAEHIRYGGARFGAGWLSPDPGWGGAA